MSVLGILVWRLRRGSQYQDCWLQSPRCLARCPRAWSSSAIGAHTLYLAGWIGTTPRTRAMSQPGEGVLLCPASEVQKAHAGRRLGEVEGVSSPCQPSSSPSHSTFTCPLLILRHPSNNRPPPIGNVTLPHTDVKAHTPFLNGQRSLSVHSVFTPIPGCVYLPLVRSQFHLDIL